MPCASVHGPFERFEAADLPFGLPVAPGKFDGILHCVEVTVQNTGKPHDFYELSFDGVVDPVFHQARVAAAKDTAETHGQTPHRRKRRRAMFQRLDFRCLTFCQFASRLDAQRCREIRRYLVTGIGITDGLKRRDFYGFSVGLGQFGVAPFLQQTFQIWATTCVPTVLQVVEEVTTVAISVLPAFSKKFFEIQRRRCFQFRPFAVRRSR